MRGIMSGNGLSTTEIDLIFGGLDGVNVSQHQTDEKRSS